MNINTINMEVEHNTEPESSTAYESTTTVDSDDDTASSTLTNDKFVPPKVNRLGSSIRSDQNYAEFIKPFQTRLIAINLNGTQNDLLNFLDIFWEKLRRERNSCFTKSKATKFLCRRITHILLSVRSINKNFLYNSAYFSKVSRILAIYMDLELKASSRGTEYGVTIIERMQYMLRSHLTPPDYHHDDEYILQTFIHMERLVKAHKELVDLLFNRFIKPKSEIFDPKVLKDRMYITYLVLYKKWIDIETSAEFKKKIIEMAKKHILPQQTLKTNLKYAPYLPNWAANQNPTEFLLTSRMKFSPLIDALKIPDTEDNSDVEIVDFGNLTPVLPPEEIQSHDNTTSITNYMSSTYITNSMQEDQITPTTLDDRKKSCKFDEALSSVPYTTERNIPTGESIIIQPKKEPDDSLLNQDGVIDLTADEVDVGNFDDIRLSWINVLEPKAKCSLMLPPPNYGPRKVIDKIIILDDDDDDETETNTKIKPSVDSENSSDSNLCNFLEKTKLINNNNISANSTTETANSGYSITSPTDSGIIMTNSGRNTVCSLYDEELTDCGLTSNDEHEPKPTTTTHKTIISKSNLMITDTELEVETDSEIENLSETVAKKGQHKISHGDVDNQLVSKISKVDKLKDNCDEIIVNNQNSELLKTIKPKIFENNTDNSKNLEKPLGQTKLRCGPITKTYQSNKKPRPRNLTPTLDIVNSTTVSSPILISPSKADITLDDSPIVLKTSKIPTNKGAQSIICDSSNNTGAVVFSMLPRQKPSVSSNFPSSTNNVTSNSITSNNVVYSTINPNAATESSKVSSLIIKDWTKPAADDDILRPDGGIDSDIDDDATQPTNILIRCNYFKTESKPSASPFSTRANSPYPNSFSASASGSDKIPPSKNLTVSKTVTTVRKTPDIINCESLNNLLSTSTSTHDSSSTLNNSNSSSLGNCSNENVANENLVTGITNAKSVSTSTRNLVNDLITNMLIDDKADDMPERSNSEFILSNDDNEDIENFLYFCTRNSIISSDGRCTDAIQNFDKDLKISSTSSLYEHNRNDEKTDEENQTEVPFNVGELLNERHDTPSTNSNCSPYLDACLKGSELSQWYQEHFSGENGGGKTEGETSLPFKKRRKMSIYSDINIIKDEDSLGSQKSPPLSIIVTEDLNPPIVTTSTSVAGIITNNNTTPNRLTNNSGGGGLTISYPGTPMLSIASLEYLPYNITIPRAFKTPAELKEMPPINVQAFNILSPQSNTVYQNTSAGNVQTFNIIPQQQATVVSSNGNAGNSKIIPTIQTFNFIPQAPQHQNNAAVGGDVINLTPEGSQRRYIESQNMNDLNLNFSINTGNSDMYNIHQPNTLQYTTQPYHHHHHPNQYYHHHQQSNPNIVSIPPIDLRNMINLSNYQLNPQHLSNFLHNSQINFHAKKTLVPDLVCANNMAGGNQSQDQQQTQVFNNANQSDCFLNTTNNSNIIICNKPQQQTSNCCSGCANCLLQQQNQMKKTVGSSTPTVSSSVTSSTSSLNIQHNTTPPHQSTTVSRSSHHHTNNKRIKSGSTDRITRSSNRTSIVNYKDDAGSVPFFNLLEYYSIEEPKVSSKRPPSRNKRVAFANSVVEYKTEKVDEKNNLKIRFKKQPAVNKPQRSPPRRSNSPSKKSILKKLPKAKPCSVLLKKLPVDSEPGRVASILIRRNSVHSTNQPFENKEDEGYSVWRRDYTTDYDDVLTEQRKMHKKKRTKRKRSRSLSGAHANFKKLRKIEIVRSPSTKQLSVVVKPLNLNKLFDDPNVNIKFGIESEANNEIYDSFQIGADENSLRSTPTFNLESPDHVDALDCSAFKDPEPEAVEQNNVIEQDDGVADQDTTNDIMNEQDTPNKVTESEETANKIKGDQKIQPKFRKEVSDYQNIDIEVMDDQKNEKEILSVVNIENKINDLIVEKQVKPDQTQNDQSIGVAKNNERTIFRQPSTEIQLCDESIVVSTLRFLPEPDPSDDETVVSTTYEIQEELETEVVVESMSHDVMEDVITSPTDEILQTKTMEGIEEIVEGSIPRTEEVIISKTPECEYDSLNVSGASEEIQDTNKIITEESNDQAPESFLDRLNGSGASDEAISSDTNVVGDASVAQTINRMLRSKAAKVLTASSCLDQISVGPKNGVGKNGRDTPERSDDIENDINKNIISIKSSVTTTAEDEFLMDEYIDDDEIVVVASHVELNNHRSEGDQSCTSEEIPSPPFETVIPKITEKMDVTTKKLKIETTPIAHSSLEVSIESPPFDEVLDLKSFGTLENDSSISEMENVGKRVNDNFNEIDEDEETDGLDMNADTESLALPKNQLISSNQNDVTTTTLSSAQKKKNLVHRPYNRHIKINNKKRNSSSNSSGSDIPETIVSSTTISTNHLVAIANQVEFNGTNNSSATYNLFCQINHDECSPKKRRGRPKGSKNKRKDATPQMTVRSDIFQYSQITPPPLIKPVTNRRQTYFYQHHEIAPSSAPSRPMLFNNNPPYRPPYNASEESLNQINRNRSLPIQPFNRHQTRLSFRTPSCDSDEQPLIHLKHHHPNPTSHPGYDRKHKKLKRNDSNSPPFSLEKQFGVDKDLMDSTKTYLKVQEARTIFVPEDIDKLIQNQTTVEPSMNATSPITTTYRYDPGGGGSCNNGVISNCANTILNNSNSSSLSDPITQSHQFVSYDTSSSPERILTQHEHNYSNDR